MTLFLRRETGTTKGRPILLGDILQKKEIMALGTFTPIQFMMNKHGQDKKNNRYKNRKPGLVTFSKIQAHKGNRNKRK